VELTIDDHRSIKRNANRFIDEITGLFSPGARTDARLFGLRALMMPMVHPDESKSNSKQLLQHRSIDIDGVVFSTRLTPKSEVLGPVTRLRTKRSRYHVPWVHYLERCRRNPKLFGTHRARRGMRTDTTRRPD
jgi:hypothetical protein